MSGKSKREWLILAASAIVLLGGDFAYVRWRTHSLEPLTAAIDLTRPGTYKWCVFAGFYPSKYHPEFRLALPFEVPSDWNWGGDGYERLWGATAPVVDIEVWNARGERLLHERSALTRSDGWTITGGFRTRVAELYKFNEFTPQMFGSGTVKLEVIRGSLPAGHLHPQFDVSVVKYFQLFPTSMIFLALVVLTGIAFVVTAAMQVAASRHPR